MAAAKGSQGAFVAELVRAATKAALKSSSMSVASASSFKSEASKRPASDHAREPSSTPTPAATTKKK
jgi:hypothetical protein